MSEAKSGRDWTDIQQTFQKVWGYTDLRTSQKEIVTSLLQGQDSLAIMATGGGKSICFQLPALLQDGLTLVISPLLALMEDQVKDLKSRNLAAACLHSAFTQRKFAFVYTEMHNSASG